MKNVKIALLTLCSIALLNSCEKENNNPVTPDESIKLEGKWIIKEIDFKSNVKAWRSETITNALDLFGWAPYMFQSASGLEFTKEDYADPQTGKSGKVFKLVTGGSYGSSAKVYWIWNQTGDGKAFEVVQLNSQLPPYDFSMSKTSSLEETKIDGKRVLTFTTTLVSIDQDKLDESPNPITRPKVAATATFTLLETTGEIDTEASPALKLNGTQLKLPQQTDPAVATQENLKETAWMLKPQSKIYDPGKVAQDPALEFAKLVSLYFENESVLKFRYSFPLGIITTKETTWQYDNQTHTLSYIKAAGAMGGSPMKFVWKASYLIHDEGKSLLLELKETINDAGLQTESKLDLSAIDDNLLKREFVSISPGDAADESTVINKDNYTIFTK